MFPYFPERGVPKSSALAATATFILRNRPTTHIKTGCGLDGDRREGRKRRATKMLRKKEARGRKSFRRRLCSFAPGAGWMCDLRGQPSSEQQQFTVAHQPTRQPSQAVEPQIPLSSSSRTRQGPPSDSGQRLRGVFVAVLRIDGGARLRG